MKLSGVIFIPLYTSQNVNLLMVEISVSILLIFIFAVCRRKYLTAPTLMSSQVGDVVVKIPDGEGQTANTIGEFDDRDFSDVKVLQKMLTSRNSSYMNYIIISIKCCIHLMKSVSNFFFHVVCTSRWVRQVA